MAPGMGWALGSLPTKTIPCSWSREGEWGCDLVCAADMIRRGCWAGLCTWWFNTQVRPICCVHAEFGSLEQCCDHGSVWGTILPLLRDVLRLCRSLGDFGMVQRKHKESSRKLQWLLRIAELGARANEGHPLGKERQREGATADLGTGSVCHSNIAGCKCDFPSASRSVYTELALLLQLHCSKVAFLSQLVLPEEQDNLSWCLPHQWH